MLLTAITGLAMLIIGYFAGVMLSAMGEEEKMANLSMAWQKRYDVLEKRYLLLQKEVETQIAMDLERSDRLE